MYRPRHSTSCRRGAAVLAGLAWAMAVRGPAAAAEPSIPARTIPLGEAGGAHRPIKHAFAPWAPDAVAKTVGDWVFVDGEWAAGPGRLEQTADRQQGVLAFNRRVLGDTALSARFRAAPTRGGVGAVDFIFRAQSSATYYFVRFDSANQHVSLHAATDNMTYSIVQAGYEPNPIPIALGVFHDASVIARGNTIRVILDGTAAFSSPPARIRPILAFS